MIQIIAKISFFQIQLNKDAIYSIKLLLCFINVFFSLQCQK